MQPDILAELLEPKSLGGEDLACPEIAHCQNPVGVVKVLLSRAGNHIF